MCVDGSVVGRSTTNLRVSGSSPHPACYAEWYLRPYFLEKQPSVCISLFIRKIVVVLAKLASRVL